MRYPKLRDRMDLQVKRVRDELISGEGGLDTLRRAWVLWRVTQEEIDSMGARTSGLIVQGVTFDTIKELEKDCGPQD